VGRQTPNEDHAGDDQTKHQNHASCGYKNAEQETPTEASTALCEDQRRPVMRTSRTSSASVMRRVILTSIIAGPLHRCLVQRLNHSAVPSVSFIGFDFAVRDTLLRKNVHPFRTLRKISMYYRRTSALSLLPSRSGACHHRRFTLWCSLIQCHWSQR